MLDATRYGPWALILGGSEGIGVSFANELGAAGINTILVARNGPLLEAMAGELRARHGVEVRTLALDLTAPDMIDRIGAVTDDIDIGFLVYNAAAVRGGGGRFLERPVEDAIHTLDLIARGAILVSHHFGARMAARGRGGIVLMGSLAGNAGGVNLAAYSGTKAFTQMFAESLWVELKPAGVDVLCYVVGATDTPSRARLNLTDQPGDIISDPDDVAREAIALIADGPVHTPAHLAESFRSLSAMGRREAVETMSGQLTTLSVGQDG